MRPPFTLLASHYPSNRNVPQEDLFREIGWDDLIGNPAYVNTCAIRVSLALIKAGTRIRGRLAIKKGLFKGKAIEPGQAKLSLMLAEAAYFDKPEKFKTTAAEAAIGERKGVVAFWKIPGYLNGQGGHIDIVAPALGGIRVCGSGCYWDSSEVWFWSLN
jgi:hypothetical protein